MPDESSSRWSRISELFDEAVQRPPEQREAFLREACGGDPDLRRRVEELLASSDRASVFLEHPPFSRAGRLLRQVAGGLLPDSSSPAPESPPPAAEPAGTIGPYRLLEKIGEGGMGEVWRAEQSHPIHRLVALKLIKAGMDTKQIIARFEAERQALALMEHPCIARVHEAGETPRGRPYFAMEYVPGEPITAHCDRQRSSVRERLELFLQVCEAVQHAHHKGIIHRDLKPSNVLVSVRDGRAFPKIIDFGVAKATTQRLTERTMFTDAGAFVGTPEYMSPEQAEITGIDLDTRTDVYSLGVMLYELLTGTLPFASKELREAGIEEIRRRIREEEPPRPSARLRTLGERTTEAAENRKTDPRRLVSALRGELDWIVMRALEKDRTRRYATPHDLGADLGRYLRHEPVEAGPPGAAYRTRKFVRRHRIAVAVAVTALAGVVAFGVSLAVQTRRIAAERDRAERVTRFLVDLFRESNPSETRGEEVTAREVLDRGAQRIMRELKSEPLVRAQMLATIGEVYLNLGLLKEAEPLMYEAAEIETRELGPENPDTLRVRSRISRILYANWQLEESEKLLGEVLEAQRRVLGDKHPDTLWTLTQLGGVETELEHLPEGEAYSRQAYEGLRQTLGDDNADTLYALRGLAIANEKSGRYAEAEKLNRRLVEGSRRVLGEGHRETLWDVQNLAATVQGQGRYEESRALYQEAYDGLSRILGMEHPDTLWVKINLGTVARDEGHLDEARRILSEAYEASRRILGKDHPETLIAEDVLGMISKKQGRHDEAERMLNEVLEARRRVLGPEDPGTLNTMAELASVESARGRNEEAGRMLRDTLDVRMRIYGAGHPGTLTVESQLADIYVKLKRYDDAEKLFTEVLRRRTENLGPRRAETLDAMYDLGLLELARGRRADALDRLQQLVDAGYADSDHLSNDPHLKPLHGDSGFERVIAAARRNAETSGGQSE